MVHPGYLDESAIAAGCCCGSPNASSQESLSIARSQNARWFELRAARGYASLLIEAQRPDEARQALQVCDWFTEGRETLDFVYADGLRKTL